VSTSTAARDQLGARNSNSWQLPASSPSRGVVLWRAGLRISEALALAEADLDLRRGAVLVRAGKGRPSAGGRDGPLASEQPDPWLELRRTLPIGVFCVPRGAARGRPCAPAAIRGQLHRTAQAAGVRRRFAPHQIAP
jgi:site-specific recombinase XerC